MIGIWQGPLPWKRCFFFYYWNNLWKTTLFAFKKMIALESIGRYKWTPLHGKDLGFLMNFSRHGKMQKPFFWGESGISMSTIFLYFPQFSIKSLFYIISILNFKFQILDIAWHGKCVFFSMIFHSMGKCSIQWKKRQIFTPTLFSWNGNNQYIMVNTKFDTMVILQKNSKYFHLMDLNLKLVDLENLYNFQILENSSRKFSKAWKYFFPVPGK